jgi:signal transduction histidine kinase
MSRQTLDPDNAPKIMVVEDSPTQAALLEHLLKKNGYRVTVTQSGKDALESLEYQKQDLVLSDIVMPGMDGYELTRAIKSREELRSIPVILLTSLSDPEDILKGLDAKVDSYLTKPWDDKFLLDKVSGILESKPRPIEEKDLTAVEVKFRGKTREVNLAPSHSLNLLFSTYENAVMINSKLFETQLELKALNRDLEKKVQERTSHLEEEIARRKETEASLEQAKSELEIRVRERTQELVEANRNLEKEILDRKSAEQEVRRFNETLEAKVAERTEALERSNRELKEFAYVVSHDLKAPLRAVSQLADWLSDDYGEALGESGLEMIKMLQGRLDRMHGLIEGILEYSRLGRVKERESLVDFNQVARDVTEFIAPPDNIQVIVENELPITNYERTRAEQLIQNLISNAIKFCDKDEGWVKIYSEELEDGWKISVADNGPGIDPKYHGKIFQIFQTLAPRDSFESTGIGLTLVKKIVHMHGGEIWVESQEGSGAVFNFTIPKQS